MAAFLFRTLLIVIVFLINESQLKGAIAGNPCRKKPCQNNGSCQRDRSLKAGYYCECVEGFQGENCEIVFAPCKGLPCKHGGECVLSEEEDDGFHCECLNNYTGETCQELADPCDANHCDNGGECVIDDTVESGFRCNCVPAYPGFVGKFCEIPVDEKGCREGYAFEVWNYATQSEFNHDIKPNNFNYNPLLFSWILKKSNLFMVLKGEDSLHITSKVKNQDFYVLKVSVETREVRKVIIDFKGKRDGKKVRTFITEKILKSIKGDYTLSDTVKVPNGGYKVSKIEVSFRITPGINDDNGLQDANGFWVKNAEFLVCVPIF